MTREKTDDHLIRVGRVADAFGVKGELRITTYTEAPQTLLGFKALFRADGSPALSLTAGRPQGGKLVARAKGVDDRNAAEALKGLELFVPRSALPAPDEDEFYLEDLIGLSAVTLEGERLGVVKTVRDFGAGDVLEIEPEKGSTWWIAFTKETVPDVWLSAGEIIVVKPTES